MYSTHAKNLINKSFFSFKRHITTAPLTRLPILELMLDKVLTSKQPFPLTKTAIVYIHHPLQTSVNLVDCMIRLGARPRNIFILGKKYSECPAVVKQIMNYGVHYQPCSKQIGLGQFSNCFTRDVNWLWKNLIDNLKEDVKQVLVLDHGGYALSFIPDTILKRYKVIGVEKTTAGLIKLNEQGLPPFPIIGVANCAAKKKIESPLIAEAIVNKLIPLIPPDPKKITCGVIGYGAIGKAVANKLLSMNYQVIVHDRYLTQLESSDKILATYELSMLIASSDHIFGCTGQNIINSLEPFRLSQKDKTLISCSSEDKEFLPLLKEIQKKNNYKSDIDPLSEIQYRSDRGAIIRILKGGFPVNFDNSGESVVRDDIQLTRALVLASILQAAQLFKKNQIPNTENIHSLDPQMQSFVVNEWFKNQPEGRFSKSVIDNFKDPEWIALQSTGPDKSYPNSIDNTSLIPHTKQAFQL